MLVFFLALIFICASAIYLGIGYWIALLAKGWFKISNNMVYVITIAWPFVFLFWAFYLLALSKQEK